MDKETTRETNEPCNNGQHEKTRARATRVASRNNTRVANRTNSRDSSRANSRDLQGKQVGMLVEKQEKEKEKKC